MGSIESMPDDGVSDIYPEEVEGDHILQVPENVEFIFVFWGLFLQHFLLKILL